MPIKGWFPINLVNLFCFKDWYDERERAMQEAELGVKEAGERRLEKIIKVKIVTK